MSTNEEQAATNETGQLCVQWVGDRVCGREKDAAIHHRIIDWLGGKHPYRSPSVPDPTTSEQAAPVVLRCDGCDIHSQTCGPNGGYCCAACPKLTWRNESSALSEPICNARMPHEDPPIFCAMYADHVSRGQSHIGGGYSWPSEPGVACCTGKCDGDGRDPQCEYHAPKVKVARCAKCGEVEKAHCHAGASQPASVAVSRSRMRSTGETRMEPKREPGDDRVMWKLRPLRSDGTPDGQWCVIEEQGGALDDWLSDVDLGHSYEVRREIVTAEQWNAMPEFGGW